MTEHEKLVERVARSAAARDSGPEGSALFEIHWREFGEGYKPSMRAAIATIYEALSETTPHLTSGDHAQFTAMLAASPLNPNKTGDE